MSLVPKISAGGIQKALFSPEILAVGSAVIFGATAAAWLTSVVAKVPFFDKHVVAGLIILSILIILVAVKMKSGTTIRAIIIGLAGGTFFIALLQIPTISRAVASVTRFGR